MVGFVFGYHRHSLGGEPFLVACSNALPQWSFVSRCVTRQWVVSNRGRILYRISTVQCILVRRLFCVLMSNWLQLYPRNLCRDRHSIPNFNYPTPIMLTLKTLI